MKHAFWTKKGEWAIESCGNEDILSSYYVGLGNTSLRVLDHMVSTELLGLNFLASED